MNSSNEFQDIPSVLDFQEYSRYFGDSSSTVQELCVQDDGQISSSTILLDTNISSQPHEESCQGMSVQKEGRSGFHGPGQGRIFFFQQGTR